MKKILLLLIALLPTFCNAEDITKDSNILVDNSFNKKICDSNEDSYVKIKKNSIVTISNNKDIYGIYIVYELSSKKGIISNETNEAIIGENGYLHEYINVEEMIGSSKYITLKYNEDVKISEIYVLSEGTLPEYIEVWNPPLNNADLLLLSTHSDDEQLFFAGLIPHYINYGADIEVVYFTNHFDNPKRLHEQLHGLYTIGIKNYPIIGFVPDAWSTTLDEAITNLNKSGFTEDDVIKYEVEMIRRFKPLVVVGHDELGEYSHGQHILNTYVLKKALELTNDYTYDVSSINKYGLWEVPKTYLHLYKDNKITMNYDIPLEHFNKKTAYEVAKDGYSKHKSQQFTWFTKWLTGIDDKGEGTPITSMKEITTYSPLEYGLYKSSVGKDTNKNDMFENLIIRKNIIEEEIEEEKETIVEDKPVKKNSNIYILLFINLSCIIILIFLFKLLHNRKKCNK